MARWHLVARAKVGGFSCSQGWVTKIRPEAIVDMLLRFVHFSKELQWFSCGHVFGMFESPYENKGLVNFIFESIRKNATRLMKY